MKIKSILGITSAYLIVNSYPIHAAILPPFELTVAGLTCGFEANGSLIFDGPAQTTSCRSGSTEYLVDDGQGGLATLNAVSSLHVDSNSLWSRGITSPSYTGSTALFSNNDGGLVTLRANMIASGILDQITIMQGFGNIFDFISIDLSELVNAASQNTSITFTGKLSGGGLASSTVTLDGIFGQETFLFGDTFRGVTSVSWIQEGDWHQFDNIVVDNVTGTINSSIIPVPAAVWLFGSGLLGLFGIARRKKA